MRKVLNIAHRGASGHAPENTLAAFQKAVEMGADMIELDLHLSQDGEMVVIHDRFLKRTTGYRGRVGLLPLKTLKTLDAGSWFHVRYQGERIPTLKEVLDLVGDRVRVNIEIKKDLRPYRDLEEKLLACLQSYPYSRPLLSSFDERILQKIRKLDKDMAIGYLFEKGTTVQILRKAQRLGAVSVHGSIRTVSGELIHQAHGEGRQVFVYTVNELDQMRHWTDRNVDGLFTNYPDRLSALLRAT